jgi:hypothetical protein
MALNFNVKGASSLNTRLYFSNKETAVDGYGVPSSITLRTPTTRETFFRRLRNVLTFGAWTPLVSNRKDWQAFRCAVGFQAQRIIQSNRSVYNPTRVEDYLALKAVLDKAFSTYSSHERLTSSKAAAIMSAIRKGMAAGSEALTPLPEGGPTKLSQGLWARGLNTLNQRQNGRELNSHVGRLDADLAALGRGLEQVNLGPSVDVDFSMPDEHSSEAERPGLSPQQAMLQSLQSERSQLMTDVAQTQKILKLGHPAGHDLVDKGLQALQAQFGSHLDKSMIYPGSKVLPQAAVHGLGGRLESEAPCADHLGDLAGQLSGNEAVKNQLKKPASTSSIVAIPLALQGGRSLTHENHSVLVALDLKSRQVLYLDAKGESPRAAERNYRNTQGLQLALEGLGRSVFGGQWRPSTGISMLSNAKQQGANDCFAFTHDFTRRLLEGQQLGDIDRSMGVVERDGRSPAEGEGEHLPGTSELDGIRARMARDIMDHVLQPAIASFNRNARAAGIAEPDASDVVRQDQGSRSA